MTSTIVYGPQRTWVDGELFVALASGEVEASAVESVKVSAMRDDHVYGVAPRAADKRKARRAAALELAALASDPVAAAELEAAYRG